MSTPFADMSDERASLYLKEIFKQRPDIRDDILRHTKDFGSSKAVLQALCGAGFISSIEEYWPTDGERPSWEAEVAQYDAQEHK